MMIQVHCGDGIKLREVICPLLIQEKLKKSSDFFHFQPNYFVGGDKEVSVVRWTELCHSNMQSVSESARYFSFDLYCPLEYWS